MAPQLISEVRSPPDEEYQLLCRSCGVASFHKALSVIRVTEDIEEVGIVYWSDYMIVQCLGCRQISYYSEFRNSEDSWFNPETEQHEPDLRTEVYPPRVACATGVPDSGLLPLRIQEIYKETLTALANRQSILAGIGIRAILEAVCRQKGLDAGGLEVRIDKLKHLGVVTAEGAEILHGLRFLGNTAAHEIRAPSATELEVAMGVVNYLLTGTYLLPDRARILRRRDSARVPTLAKDFEL